MLRTLLYYRYDPSNLSGGMLVRYSLAASVALENIVYEGILGNLMDQ